MTSRIIRSELTSLPFDFCHLPAPDIDSVCKLLVQSIGTYTYILRLSLAFFLASSKMNNAVAGIQGIIGYTFVDGSLVWEAVSAAGSIISGGGRRFPDGNKRLAILGDTVLQLALAENWYDGTEPRGNSFRAQAFRPSRPAEKALATFSRIRQQIGSNNNLNRIGLANNIDAFINLAGGQATVSPATRAATVEAIIGAVYLDSNNMNIVKGAMRALGLSE